MASPVKSEPTQQPMQFIHRVRFVMPVHFGPTNVTDSLEVGKRDCSAVEEAPRGLNVVLAGKTFLVPWAQVMVVQRG